MKSAHRVGLQPFELVPQQLGEQVVVAVPLTPTVERDEEEVRALYFEQPLGCVARLEHVVAERPRHALQDGRAEQEVAHVRVKPVQHLAAQVVDDVAVIACERLDEGARVVAARERERSEV